MFKFPIYMVVIPIVIFAVIVIFLILVKKKQKYEVAGTMHIDTSRNDKDICLFTLDMPLEDIQKEQYVLIRIDGESNLKEWSK